MSIQNLNGIKYTEQTLTSAQQAQARQNIGAAEAGGSVDTKYFCDCMNMYNTLTVFTTRGGTSVQPNNGAELGNVKDIIIGVQNLNGLTMYDTPRNEDGCSIYRTTWIIDPQKMQYNGYWRFYPGSEMEDLWMYPGMNDDTQRGPLDTPIQEIWCKDVNIVLRGKTGAYGNYKRINRIKHSLQLVTKFTVWNTTNTGWDGLWDGTGDVVLFDTEMEKFVEAVNAPNALIGFKIYMPKSRYTEFVAAMTTAWGSTAVNDYILPKVEQYDFVYSEGFKYRMSTLPELTGKYEPFYVENNTNSALTFSIAKSDTTAPTITLEKSSNGLTWESFGTTSVQDLTLNLAVGQKVYLRANATTYSADSSSYHFTKFDTSNAGGKIGGNIMSLLYGSSFTGEETEFPTGSTRTFEKLFYNSKLTDSSELLMPAISLVEYCYSEMFRGTSNMSKAVKCLPATNSASHCYYQMFYSSGINSIIDIKLTNASAFSYAMFEMFKICSSLINPPILADSIFGIDEQTTYSMFQNCTSLKTVPATTLFIGGGGSWCSYMFYNCTSLVDASSLTLFFTSGLNQNGAEYMFGGCTSLKRGVTMKCENFLNCPTNTFDGMYNGCSSLKYIEARFMQRSGGEPVAVNLDSFSNGVATDGVFVKGKDVLWTTGTTGIPTGWTVIEQ